MKVLVACEFSGTVRNAFAKLGHDAWSCDLLPAEGKHIEKDCLEIINDGWDLMIAHPPCTYLSAAGLHFCKNNPKRIELREEALVFVRRLSEAPIEKIAIENPVGFLSTAWRKPDQVCYMNDFDHAEARKPTCLWLKNLPKIHATKKVDLIRSKTGKRVSEWYGRVRDPKLRSITFQGFADALADQWGNL